MSIPIIDIAPLHTLSTTNDDTASPSVTAVVSQISTACQTHGFFAVTNHNVPSPLITKVCDESERFFDLPKSIKEEVRMTGDYPYGYENYEALGTELNNSSNASSGVATDSKETFSIGPSNTSSKMPPRQYPPSAPPSFASTLEEYYKSMETLAQTLFRGIALALSLPTNYFLSPQLFDEGHQSALRILNYPLLHYPTPSSSSNNIVIRAGEHTDYGAITILHSGGPGLQLFLGEWIDVPHLDGAFVVNLGDLMERWTNERWRSTLHRVVAVPDDGETNNVTGDGDNYGNGDAGNRNDDNGGMVTSGRRQSIAFFVNMNGEARISPFESCVDEQHPRKYQEIKASEYLMQRHLRSMGKG